MVSCRLQATFFFLTIVSIISPSKSATCATQAFYGKKVYIYCTDLPTLSSFLHWTYNEAQSTLSIAFIAQPAQPDGWVSWAINPTGTGMLGAQALIAFRDAGGGMTVKTYNISSHGPLVESEVWYEVKESSAEFSYGMIRIFATLLLPKKGLKTLNHVWQVGATVTGGVPDKLMLQPGNMNSEGSLDLLEGVNNEGQSDFSGTLTRYIHGGVNIVSWGIMFPIGIIIARYLRKFPSADPAWFFLHVSFQILAYVFGLEGMGFGLVLANESKGITYSCHRNIGFTLFVLATLQIFSALLKPEKEHKYRFYWNIYHHGCGYTILVLSIINVFLGFNMLKPKLLWKNLYTSFITVLIGIPMLFDGIAFIIAKRRSRSTVLPQNHDDHNKGQDPQETPAVLDKGQDQQESPAVLDKGQDQQETSAVSNKPETPAIPKEGQIMPETPG